MIIELERVKPLYMSEVEVSPSDIYLKDKVVFEKGKKYLIKADSGHGKTSILNFIYGSNTNYSGQINYNSGKTSVFNLRKSKISYVFQDFKLFLDLSVFENIQLKNSLTGYKSSDEIDSLIKRALLGHIRDKQVKTLSLGQRQRVAIIRAICQPFDFLLLDEPFSHLDENNIKIVGEILNHEIDIRNAGLILTSLHDEQIFDFDEVLNL